MKAIIFITYSQEPNVFWKMAFTTPHPPMEIPSMNPFTGIVVKLGFVKVYKNGSFLFTELE